MHLLTPRSLDASICDVFTKLNETQKADVLLHALQYVPIQKSCRSVIENAVQSLLQVSNLPSSNLARALLLRAKGRFAAGYHTSARQDLHSASIADPKNEDITEAADIQEKSLSVLSQRTILNTPVPEKKQDGSPHKINLAVELWQRIAAFLPRHDLTSLLLVSKVFSSIANVILSREIDLHLTTAMEPGESLGFFSPTAVENPDESIRTWNDQRNIEILTRILVDTRFAAQVRSLDVFAVPSSAEPRLGFKVGMLMSAIPKLFNLRKVHCSGDKELILGLLQVLFSYHPSLERLSLVVTENGADIAVPTFKHLKNFSIRSNSGNDSLVQVFLGQIRDTLCGLSIKNASWNFPANNISVWNLTQFEFQGSSIGDVFMEILNNGHQLESLKLSGTLQSSTSCLIRQNRDALPFLCHFSFTLARTLIDDSGFCPAIFEFLQKRAKLQTCELFVLESQTHRIGFDASSWAALPALYGLHALSITYPRDLPLVMAGLLVPRTVRALTLDLSWTDSSGSNFFNQLGKGMPPDLHYVCMVDNRRVNHNVEHIERAFPGVSVVRINGTFWTVTKSLAVDSNVQVVQWPARRAKYCEAEWLDSLGCGDAIWTGVDE